ncbi:hypothetical protein DCS_04384 [Drechmeria coniospora]|uniref:Uncharacterized protein n=1 Tax=Drechmeria coniospora TaxID=98403 RepID=A0A151GJT9_DRECN|nr:hypothetical protein DCS_04384 [Drechmeria coniospora]KYK57375.1 hypothetical protein DCS_04384 [Drechmeria coniospora]
MRVSSSVLSAGLTVLLCSSGALGQNSHNSAIDTRLRQLEKALQLRVGGDDAAYRDGNSRSESSCFRRWWTCHDTRFFDRHRLANQTSHRLSTVSQIDADIDIPNYNGSDAQKFPDKVTAKTSTAVANKTSEGWSIAVTVSGGIGEVKSLAGDVGFDHTWSRASARTVTKEVMTEAPCLPGFRCFILTYTYHVTIDGFCRPEPWLDCGGEMNACKLNRNSDGSKSALAEMECDQYTDYAFWNCDRRAKPCQVYTPLLHADGSPVTSQAVMRQELSGNTIFRRASKKTKVGKKGGGRQMANAGLPTFEFLDDVDSVLRSF